MSTNAKDSTEIINKLSDDVFHQHMLACCASPKYASSMVASRPFTSISSLFDVSKDVLGSLSTDEWLTAFSAHPRIGASKAGHSSADRSAKWSEKEQASVSGAETEVLSELQELNDRYYEKHGFVFLICATGKSAGEMLQQLRVRLGNETEKEIQNAAEEQLKITEIRLRNMASEGFEGGEL